MNRKKKLNKLIKNHEIKVNSKDIQKGDIFILALGNYNKENYINDAINKKCSLIISESDIKSCVPHIKVNDTNLYLKKILDYKYNNPLLNKKLIGVTGTDGKTTVVTIVRDMINGASIGTNGLEFNDFKMDLNNTTPNLVELYKCFDIINKNNIREIVMEVSSESFLTKRIPNLLFDIGVFLNISLEHIDKHKTFDNYLECKRELLLNSKIKIINKDDKYFKKIIKNMDNYLTFGKKKSDLEITNYQLFFNKTEIDFKYKNKKYHITSPLLGEYNVYNLAASILVLLALNYEMEDIIERIKYIKKPHGRMELINVKSHLVMIDYAHTIMATQSILKFLNKYSKKNIITIVGCAGDRYKEKRKVIGKLALKYSKLVIFTTDDPRWENPFDIILEMIGKSKKKNYCIELEREKAIERGLKVMDNSDLLLILGKGRDNYMAIRDRKIKYSDINILKKYDKYVK